MAMAVAVAMAGVVPSLAETTSGETPAVRGPVTNLPLPRFVSIRAETANARRGPGLDQRVDWAFTHRGLPLEVIAEYGQWRRVRDVDGMGGWVHQALLSGVRTVLVRGDAAVPLRSAPSERSTVRALAEPGAIARVQACEGAWCEITSGGLGGWLPRDAVWGVRPDETID